MSAHEHLGAEPEASAAQFIVLLASLQGAGVALDASALVSVVAEGGNRVARFSFPGPCMIALDDAEPRVVAIAPASLHGLPSLLEDLEQRGVMGLIEHDGQLYTLLDARVLCAAPT